MNLYRSSASQSISSTWRALPELSSEISQSPFNLAASSADEHKAGPFACVRWRLNVHIDRARAGHLARTQPSPRRKPDHEVIRVRQSRRDCRTSSAERILRASGVSWRALPRTREIAATGLPAMRHPPLRPVAPRGVPALPTRRTSRLDPWAGVRPKPHPELLAVRRPNAADLAACEVPTHMLQGLVMARHGFGGQLTSLGQLHESVGVVAKRSIGCRIVRVGLRPRTNFSASFSRSKLRLCSWRFPASVSDHRTLYNGSPPQLLKCCLPFRTWCRASLIEPPTREA
jgi:hypothetical protein